MQHIFLFGEQGPPDAVLNIEVATGDGQLDMGMLPELTATGVQGAENTDFDAHFAGKAGHGRVALRNRSLSSDHVVASIYTRHFINKTQAQTCV